MGYRCLDDFVGHFGVMRWWLDCNSEGLGERVLVLGSCAGNWGMFEEVVENLA